MLCNKFPNLSSVKEFNAPLLMFFTRSQPLSSKLYKPNQQVRLPSNYHLQLTHH